MSHEKFVNLQINKKRNFENTQAFLKFENMMILWKKYNTYFESNAKI